MSVAAALLSLTLAGAPVAPRIELEAAFVYGYGSRTALGAAIVGSAGWPVWQTSIARGSFLMGLWAGYQNEPYALTAALAAPADITGSSHRLELFVVAGHEVWLWPSRRLLVGLELFAGWTHLAQRAHVTLATQGISRSTSADGSEFTFGLLVPVGVRVSERVSVVARFVLPWPWGGIAISSYFMASLGLSGEFEEWPDP